MVEMDGAEFTNSYLDATSDGKDFNVIVWNESNSVGGATTTINNSVFASGTIAVKNINTNIYSSIQNSSFNNFVHTEGPIQSIYNFPTLINNTFANNTSNYINLGSWTLASDATLNSGINYLFNSITVPKNITLTISSGASLTMSGGDIKIDGVLEAKGEAGKEINIKPKSYWGRIIFNNSSSSLDYVNFTGGNHAGTNSNGLVSANNSILNFSNINFSDVERPYNMFYLANSTTTIQSSVIGWATPYVGTKTVEGIRLFGGNLTLDGVSFKQMKIGIEASNSATLLMKNMSMDSFQDVSSYKWSPLSIWTFPTSTPT
jgi:hypothetical protein